MRIGAPRGSPYKSDPKNPKVSDRAYMGIIAGYMGINSIFVSELCIPGDILRYLPFSHTYRMAIDCLIIQVYIVGLYRLELEYQKFTNLKLGLSIKHSYFMLTFIFAT